MNISGLPFYCEFSTLRAEGSPIKFPIFGFVSFPYNSEASWTSLSGLVITLKAGASYKDVLTSLGVSFTLF